MAKSKPNTAERSGKYRRARAKKATRPRIGRKTARALRLEAAEGVCEGGVSAGDSSGNILAWKAATSRIKGYSEDEIVGFQIFYFQAVRARDEFFSIASHEPRAPFASLSSQWLEPKAHPEQGVLPASGRLAEGREGSLCRAERLTEQLKCGQPRIDAAAEAEVPA